MGLAEAQRGLENFVRKFEAQSAEVLAEQSEKILARAKELAPVKTGRLRDSGFLSGVERTSEGLRIRVGFATEYAAKVHELHPTQGGFLRCALAEKQKRTPLSATMQLGKCHH